MFEIRLSKVKLFWFGAEEKSVVANDLNSSKTNKHNLLCDNCQTLEFICI